jgi:hypothetical protein
MRRKWWCLLLTHQKFHTNHLHLSDKCRTLRNLCLLRFARECPLTSQEKALRISRFILTEMWWSPWICKAKSQEVLLLQQQIEVRIFIAKYLSIANLSGSLTKVSGLILTTIKKANSSFTLQISDSLLTRALSRWWESNLVLSSILSIFQGLMLVPAVILHLRLSLWGTSPPI